MTSLSSYAYSHYQFCTENHSISARNQITYDFAILNSLLPESMERFSLYLVIKVREGEFRDLHKRMINNSFVPMCSF